MAEMPGSLSHQYSHRHILRRMPRPRSNVDGQTRFGPSAYFQVCHRPRLRTQQMDAGAGLLSQKRWDAGLCRHLPAPLCPQKDGHALRHEIKSATRRETVDLI
ncbi:hypothetical protein D3C72_2003300 [compost metagenome]